VTDKLAPAKDALAVAASFVEAEEGGVNRFTGALGLLVGAGAIAMSLFHLYAAYDIVQTQTLRYVHVGFLLALGYILFPALPRWRHRLKWWDVALAAIGVLTIYYALQGGDDFTDRNTSPTELDQAVGIVFIVLLLELTRRATGWIMPAVAVAFVVYALVGPYLPAPWTHRGYDIGRLIGHLFMTLEGIFGVAVDVSSSLIILFTIFGAVLHVSGAGKFFLDFSFAAMGGKQSGVGRSIVLASFLLGGPSGSGVATTVTLGSFAYPMLARAGYGKDAAGGLLAAGGLGAILSPPVLGAAAFLIAEFLKISYLQVIAMAAIPTVLYYLSLLVMVEQDARRFGLKPVTAELPEAMGPLLRHFGFHFISLISIVVLMLLGLSPILAVFWATVIAAALSFIRPETALYPRRGARALRDGAIGMLSIGATCATAGIIVGVVTLTGLGLKFSSIAIAYAGGSLVLTAIYTALIVWVIGLAVPVTASYIICAVIAAPALVQLGVPAYAAHMFVFYYAILSEVSPPTALSPFAAAAITGGSPYRTTLQAWKYTLPAFIVPFMFVLDPVGEALLLGLPKGASLLDGAWVVAAAMAGTAALAAAVTAGEAARRWMYGVGAVMLMFPGLLDAPLGLLFGTAAGVARAGGFALVLAGFAWRRWVGQK
jgi:TRAP transporter 4TM/12TM fusion protein